MRHTRSGALRTVVFLGRPMIVKDASGGETITFEELETFASVDALTGREWASGNAVKDSVDYRIGVRLGDGWVPDARWRVREKESGAIYNVVSVLLHRKNGSAECLAKRAPGNSDGR